jgi:hypothetical protein
LLRRDVEERAEQLKAISNLSALIAGFALVSFLQFEFAADAASESVQLAFGVSVALTVLLEANAMVICTLIHASILKTGRSYVSSQEEADFMARARQFAARCDGAGALREEVHRQDQSCRLDGSYTAVGWFDDPKLFCGFQRESTADMKRLALLRAAATSPVTARRRHAAISRRTGVMPVKGSGALLLSCSVLASLCSLPTWVRLAIGSAEWGSRGRSICRKTLAALHPTAADCACSVGRLD